MSAGFCLHCGLKLDGTADVGVVHARCMPAWQAEQAHIASTPKSSMQQQLDRIESELVPRLNRIEGLLKEIRDNTRKDEAHFQALGGVRT